MVDEDDLVDTDAHRIVERDVEPPRHIVELRVRGDAGAAAGELFIVALEYRRVPADVAQQVCREQAADRTPDDERALCHDVMRSISVSIAGEGPRSLALTFCSICSGLVAPAITLATIGLPSSQPNASSSSEWPDCAATASSFSTSAQLRSLTNSL